MNHHEERVGGPVSPALGVAVTASRGTDPQSYALTVTHVVSGIILGRILRSANPDGSFPCVDVAEVVEQVGGRYRQGCVEIDLICGAMAANSQRVLRAAERCRRSRFRAGLRRLYWHIPVHRTPERVP